MKIRPRRGSWILAFTFMLSMFAPYFMGSASAIDSGKIIFGWQQAVVSQTVNNINTSAKTSLTLTVSAAEFQDWKSSTDELNIGISLYGSGGGLIYQHSTGVNYVDTNMFTDYSLTINSSDVSAWGEVASISVFLIGKDGEFWAGNYGTQIESASLKFNDNIELLSNTEFTQNNSSWTSDIGWQACSGGAGGLPCLSAAPAPTSIVVTSLSDSLDPGTLRWAITQANATAGGIYDSISFSPSLSGTITLSSALPAISQNLTITGLGKANTIIDGNSLYRPFMVNQNVSFTLSEMTIKRGQNTNGGLIYNNRGIVSATNVRFTSMTGGSAVFNNNAGAVASYIDCTFDNLSIGIAGDYGSTPQLPAGTTTWFGYADSNFQNRTYINRGTFSNNWAGIYNYRFTKVENSTFINNSYGANVTGLNRTQIYSSTFENNSIGIYHNSWIPYTFNMGSDNRLVDGNTFINNDTSIYLDDSYNDGRRYQGWATVKNNNWDQNGKWIQYNFWNGTANESAIATPFTVGTQFTQSLNTVPTTTTTTTTTTTLPPTTTTTTFPVTTTTTETPTTTVAPVFINPFTTTTTTIETVLPASVPEQTTTTTTTTTQTPTTTTTTTTTVAATTTTTTIPVVVEKLPVPDVEDIKKIETKEELQKLVETVDLDNIKSDQAVALVTNKAFMELPNEQLADVFESIPVDELTEEQESELVQTLSAAADEVKSTFEESVDVYAAGLDDYVAVGSSIDVGTRRSLIAATTVLSTVAVAPAAGSGSGSGGGGSRGHGTGSGGSGGSSGGSGDGGNSGRKDDEPEEEEEESAEIEGPEGDEEENNFTKNSIFKYEEGTMKKRFNPWGFIKKFSKETAAMAFTISGSVVVFATLSGETRKITLIATSIAFVVHYINAMLQNDED